VSVHHGHVKAVMMQFAKDERMSNSGGPDLAAGVREVKGGRLIRYHMCCCAEG
jgi:hypothetical protein